MHYNYNTATGRKFQMSSVSDVNYRVASATVSNSDKINERIASQLSDAFPAQGDVTEGRFFCHDISLGVL